MGICPRQDVVGPRQDLVGSTAGCFHPFFRWPCCGGQGGILAQAVTRAGDGAIVNVTASARKVLRSVYTSNVDLYHATGRLSLLACKTSADLFNCALFQEARLSAFCWHSAVSRQLLRDLGYCAPMLSTPYRAGSYVTTACPQREALHAGTLIDTRAVPGRLARSPCAALPHTCIPALVGRAGLS